MKRHHVALIAAVGITAFFQPAAAMDYQITPTLTVHEEYTDNVFESSSNKRYDFITRAMPGLALKYQAPVWDWDVGYNLDYRYYARNSRNDDLTHQLKGLGHITLVDNLLFLDINDTYGRVSLDVTRNTTEESLFTNQSDQNTFGVSPYLQLRPTQRTTVKVGYRYNNIWYKDPGGVDKFEHNGYFDVGYEISPHLIASIGYLFTSLHASTRDFDKHNTYVGFKYEYAENSYLFGQGGADLLKYSSGTEYTNPFWNIGFAHVFSRTTVQLGTGVRYTDDPRKESIQETFYSGALSYNFERGAAGLSAGYTEYRTIATDTVEHRKLSGGVNLSYQLMRDLNGTVSVLAEKYDNLLVGSYTRKIFVDSTLRYQLPKDFSIGILYKYIDYHSPDIVADNKVVNRLILELRKVF